MLALATVAFVGACGDDNDPSPTPGPDAGPDDTSEDTSGDVAEDTADDTTPDAPAPDVAPDGEDDGTPDVPTEEPTLENNFLQEETEGNVDCDNLLESNCLMPFPTDYFTRVEDGERRLHFGPTSLMVNNRGTQLRGDFFHELDGWGVATPVLFTWPGATLTGTAPIFQPGASLEDESMTILLNVETGERLAHWVETDWLSDPAPHPVIVLRPAVPFEPDTRYIAALRGFVDDAGELLPAPRGFASIRDREASVVRGVHDRRAHFETAIFPVLEAHGVAREELQLAWDFTTASREDATYLMATMRERMLAAIGEDGPDYEIDTIEEVNDPHVTHMLTGRLFVPSFLEAADPITGLRRIRRDAEGLPLADGFEEVEFTLQVPANARDREEPLGVLMYGHGFIGTKSQANGGWLRSQADDYGFLILALDMQGMTDGTIEIWMRNLLRDASTMPLFTEEVMQGVMNHVAALRLMRGRFLQETDERFTEEDGSPLYDPDRLWYYGNSQGGTLGTLIMATTPDVENGVLGVPGCAFPFLLQRSTVFTNFTALLGTIYRDPVNVSLTLGLLGSAFNRIEGLVWQHHIEREPLPGATPHRVLLHVAKEDGQVHNELSFLLGRALDAPILVPTPPRPYDVWGLVEQPYPWTGSAVTEFDFGIPDQEDLRLPAPEETDTHGWLRRLPEGRDQMMHFLKTGEVLNFCEGYCLHDGRPD